MSKGFDAEAGVIGSILLDDKCLEVVEPILKPEDMALPLHRDILRIAYELKDKGDTVDPITIGEKLKESGKTLHNDYVMELYEQTPTAANAGAYAELVKKQSLRRQLREIGENLANSDIDDPFATVTDVSRLLVSIADSRRGDVVDSMAMMTAFFAYRDKMETATKMPYVSTGYSTLDKMLGGGLLNEGLYILGARPGVGKSTLALNIAENMAKAGDAVLFVSLEMSLEQLTAKRISRETRVPSNAVLMGMLTEREYSAIAVATEILSQRPLYMNRKPGATVNEIGTMALGIKDLKCIVIDYLGLIKSTTRRRSTYEEITETSGNLKALARKLGIPILCLAQLNRSVEARQNKVPVMSDLRDTGAIEQDADGIIFLHRPDYYASDKNEQVDGVTGGLELNVILAKNRHGATGKTRMAFYPSTSVVTIAR